MDPATRSRRPAVLSLCTGYAGIELGLASVLGPLHVLTYVEREAFAVANLVTKIEAGLLPHAPICTDLLEFNAGIWRGGVDILTGGYPCQPFSVAGDRRGSDDPRHLWPHVRRVVAECRPTMCFFENVRGHLSLGLRDVRCDLEELGYRVEAGLFSAEEVGAPHRRDRIYILAYAYGSRLQEHQERDSYPQSDFRHAPPQRDDALRLRADVPDPDRPRPPQRPHVRAATFASPADAAQLATAGSGWWAVEPDVGRVADGTPDRVDRLRLAGNGVVPQCAAHAFRTLNARFHLSYLLS